MPSEHLMDVLSTHGVCEEHLTMLGLLLRSTRNGSWTIHVHEGRVAQCDVRLTFPGRRAEVARVAQLIFPHEPETAV